MKTLLKTSLLFAGLTLVFSGCNIFLDGEGEEDTPCNKNADCRGELTCVQNRCQLPPACSPECGSEETCVDLQTGWTCVPYGKGGIGEPCFVKNEDEELCAYDDDIGKHGKCIHPKDDQGLQYSICVPPGSGDIDQKCFQLPETEPTTHVCDGMAFCNDSLDCVDFPLEHCTPGDNDCEPNWECHELVKWGSTCVPQDEAGENNPCFLNLFCDIDLFCDFDGYCRNMTYQCSNPCKPQELCERVSDTQWLCLPGNVGHYGEPCLDNNCFYDPYDKPHHLKCIFLDFPDEPSNTCVPGNIGGFDQSCFEFQSDFYCDPTHSCDTSNPSGPTCVPRGTEGAYCDADTLCGEGVRCLSLSQDDACVPFGLGQETEPCWRGYCEMGMKCLEKDGTLTCIPVDQWQEGQSCWQESCEPNSWCMALEDNENICAASGTGTGGYPCFRGLCKEDTGSPIDCINALCSDDSQHSDGHSCNENSHCTNSCNYNTGTCNNVGSSDFGRECEAGVPCTETNVYNQCIFFWGNPTQGHCSKRCSDSNDCGVDADLCIIGPEYLDREPASHCALTEWGNNYGVPCVEDDDCANYGGLCASFDVLDDTGGQMAYAFCTTPCGPFGCPEGWECCTGAGSNGPENFCAPALMCGFWQICPESNDCTSIPNFPICSPTDNRCTRECTGDPHCPPGATCVDNRCKITSSTR